MREENRIAKMQMGEHPRKPFTRMILLATLLASLAALQAADPATVGPLSPMHVWADYDPNKGDFKEEIVSEETKDGITNREFYISAYVLGEDVRGIVWNGTVKHLQIQMPPGALNLTIGCKGEPHKTHSKEAFFSANEPVTPASLYLAQLRERLGVAAVKNIGY